VVSQPGGGAGRRGSPLTEKGGIFSSVILNQLLSSFVLNILFSYLKMKLLG
jgi:hypothetical protein